MHKRIVSFVKYNKLILAVYQVLGNLFLFILRLFVKEKDKQILFMSFGGKKYDDSPKAIYEKIAADPFFADYKLIWGFINPDEYKDLNCTKVKVDTLRFFITALESRYWIHNSGVERGLKQLKGKNTVEINTWHGTPLKKMGKDIHDNKSFYFMSKQRGRYLYCAQSTYDQEIFARIFNWKKEHILLSDLPRNDALLCYTDAQIQDIKYTLGLPADKKIILYAPTFREYNRDALNSCYIAPPIDWQKWKARLGDQYVVLLRAHYEVVKVLGIEEDDFCFDVSAYPTLNDLIAVSDCLVSDYSSIYFDYAITEKPMFNFAYDLDAYIKFRGLYDEALHAMPCQLNQTEDALLDEIATFSPEVYAQRVRQFKQTFAPHAGHATDTVLARLKEMITATQG